MHRQHVCAPRALFMAFLALATLSACFRRTDLYPPAGAPVESATLPPAAEQPLQAAEQPPHEVAPTPEPPVHDGPPLSYRAGGDDVALPRVEREFRGVWVATVGNMDWPSRRNLTTTQAQAELLRILDTARDLGLNAIIFQIRPMGDAFYESSLEPWSDYLTGESGRPPQPYWDPLAFAIEQAHARGLELHAWFNPFRAGFVARKAPLAASHVSRRRPDLVRRYGTFYWMDPGEPDARKHSLAVIADVVNRYDVDAVHIDDYFYPYQERDARGRLIPFPDDASWARYGSKSGMTRNDWRRSNIDTFVEQMYQVVRREKPHVRVGISPFGIWRPGYPASVRGLDSYSELYADTRKWLNNGWADYYAPQLYWRTNAPQQPYTDLLQWWSEQNPHGRHIWAGNIPNNIGAGTKQWSTLEIIEQVRLTREHRGTTGNIHFSASSLRRNPDGLHDAFRSGVYATPALVPASPWLARDPVVQPSVRAVIDEDGNTTRLAFDVGPVRASAWIVHARWGNEWQTLLLPAASREVNLQWKGGNPPDLLAVRSIDRVGVESAPAVFSLLDYRADRPQSTGSR